MHNIRMYESGVDHTLDLTLLLLCCSHEHRVGPLDSELQYSVTAAKDGFVFTPTSDGVVGHFRSFKLGKIEVQVSARFELSL